jgi:hypothetical protein
MLIIFVAIAADRPGYLAQHLRFSMPGKQANHYRHDSPEAKMQTYAWLEYHQGEWHFLTHLLADPETSTRSWRDGKAALQELAAEGWILMRPYRNTIPTAGSEFCVAGYGLTRCGSMN